MGIPTDKHLAGRYGNSHRQAFGWTLWEFPQTSIWLDAMGIPTDKHLAGRYGNSHRQAFGWTLWEFPQTSIWLDAMGIPTDKHCLTLQQVYSIKTVLIWKIRLPGRQLCKDPFVCIFMSHRTSFQTKNFHILNVSF